MSQMTYSPNPSIGARFLLVMGLAVLGVIAIWLVDRKAVTTEQAEVIVEPTTEELIGTYREIVADGTDEQILLLLDQLGTKEQTSLSSAWTEAFAPDNIKTDRAIELFRKKFHEDRNPVVRAKLAAIAGSIPSPEAAEFLIFILRFQNHADVLGNAIHGIGKQAPSRELMRVLRNFKGDRRTPQNVYLSGPIYSLEDRAEQTFRTFRSQLQVESDDPDWDW